MKIDKSFSDFMRESLGITESDYTKEPKGEIENNSDEEIEVELDEETGDKDEYEKYFRDMLDKYGVKSPADLSKEDKVKFFNDVDSGWSGDNERN